jgi:tetratricopeptide (TPR) repeat protein
MNEWARWAVIGLFAGAASASYAAGGGGGGGDGPPKRDAAYQAGVKAIERQDWQRAIDLFHTSLLWDRFNADAHNWLGFAYRNQGDLDHAFAEYEAALKLDPEHKGAHEYLGEAYVLAKNLPKAKEHLAALEKLCGQACPEYRDLQAAIDKAAPPGTSSPSRGAAASAQ